MPRPYTRVLLLAIACATVPGFRDTAAASPQSLAAPAIQTASGQSATQALPSSARTSPSAARIAAAQRQLAADPKRVQTYNELALLYIQQARATGDPSGYDKAESTLAAGLKLAPGDFQLARTGVALLLGRARYPEALARAHQLNAKVPDDVTVYGYIAEASIALGDYPAADAAAQLMLNMRPNNVPGLLAGAQLREVYGDPSGALEFLNQAYGETPQIEPEELASMANRIAVIELDSGHPEAAGQALDRARQLFPASPQTQENSARLLLAQDKPKEAIAILEQQLSAEHALHASQLSTLFLLATARQQAKDPETRASFAQFALAARAASTLPGNDNPDLILYDAGLPGTAPGDPKEALALAQQDVAQRHDVTMLDAYAWALYANHRYAEAAAASQKALAVGVQSAEFDEHAGQIALGLDKPQEAAEHFASAMQIDPSSAYAEQARMQLRAAPAGMASAQPAPLTAPLAAPSTPAIAAAPAPLVPLQEVQDTGGVPTALLIPRPTGTERSIHKVQGEIAAHPADAQLYAALGAGFFQRARETGDVEDYQMAEQTLNKSLDLDSTDLSATAPLETLAEVCMGEHRFDDALDYAQRALALGSGDVSAFGIVGDAEADMGEYARAGAAYARLQSTNSELPKEAGESYGQTARTAYLQFIAGDTAGAIHQMEVAVSEGLQARLPSENLAWLYFELGEFRYQAGLIQPAANAYLTALTVYPGDYRALAGLGKVRASQGKYAEAITLYSSAIAVVPMPLYVAELGDIYTRVGDPADAEKQYKLVEYIGLLGHINQVLHNRDLALFYADHNRKLPEGLRLAHKEFEVRSDIYTWDALAWAMYKNHDYTGAQEAMGHAMRLGTKDAMLLFHSGMIEASVGNTADAEKQLHAALKLNPHFRVLDDTVATRELSTLTGKSSTLAAAGNTARMSDAR